MGKIMGNAQPGPFLLGLAAVGAGVYLIEPAGWPDWAAIALFAGGGAFAGRNWGWWRDLSP